MFDHRSSLEKCFCGEPFCWNQEPRTLYCYISQAREGFPKGDALYIYDSDALRWKVLCGGECGCQEGCLVHAMQHRDPVFMDRVYYTIGTSIADHLSHWDDVDELRRDRDLDIERDIASMGFGT